MKQWYALHSKPHKELQVRESLNSRGIEAYVPALKGRKRGSSVLVDRPYFPCYLFAHADLAEVGVSSLQYTPGLRRVVAFNEGEPTPVPDQVIALIQEKLAAMSTIDSTGHALNRGDRVVITEGPFRDYEALFDKSLSPEGRARLLIHLLGRQVPLEIPLDSVRKAEARKVTPVAPRRRG